MNKSLAFINGIFVSLMVFVNGVLSINYGVIYSTVIIHIIGFTFISLILFIKKNKFKFLKSIKLYYIFPGFIGVFTVILQNYSYEKLGATLTLTAALFGQLVFSSIIDHFGFFGIKKFKFNYKKLPAYIIIAIGIIIIGM